LLNAIRLCYSSLMKNSKTFRLSDQALLHLASIVKKTGSNETAIIELSLAFLSRQLGVSAVSKNPVQDNISLPASFPFLEKGVASLVPISSKRAQQLLHERELDNQALEMGVPEDELISHSRHRHKSKKGVARPAA